MLATQPRKAKKRLRKNKKRHYYKFRRVMRQLEQCKKKESVNVKSSLVGIATPQSLGMWWLLGY